MDSPLERLEIPMAEILEVIKKLEQYGKSQKNEVNNYYGEINTLSYWAKATKFYAEILEDNIMMIMGPNKRTLMKFKVSSIDRIIAHFKDRDWFRFEGSMEKTTPGGLRHFFETEL
jgi:hypothetical protein